MNQIEKEVIYKQALEKWGIESQLGMVQEECGEVIVAVNKLFRSGINDATKRLALCEELADVQVMINQMREVPDWAALIDYIVVEKTIRLKERLG